ncbi:MAG TPA: hypothetical protein PLV27_06000 [Anaerolineaceae bacterium]|nr:hypothetical protein [Anaerolineaceae bacterium]
MKRLPLGIKFFLLVLILAIPTLTVLANALPLPFQLYLRFYSDTQTNPKVTGVQLVGCADKNCSEPQNLTQVGDCSAAGFLSSNPLLTEDWSLRCTDTRCLLESSFRRHNNLPAMIQIRAMTDADMFITEAIPPPDCDYCTTAWKINLSTPGAAISIDETFTDPRDAFHNFWSTYLFTILVEVGTAYLVVRLIKTYSPLAVKNVLPAVFVANLLAYPISWLVIPTFGQFQTDANRKISLMVIVLIVLLTIVALFLHQRRHTVKKIVKILLWIAIPVVAVLFLIGFFFVTYSNYEIHVDGLPWVSIILLAELFAILFEAFLLSKWNKDLLSFNKFLGLSFITNAVSFALGWLVF